MNREERRRREREQRRPRLYPGLAIWINGGHVCIGVGPVDGPPVAYVLVCPVDGVAGVIAEIEGAAVVARELHG